MTVLVQGLKKVKSPTVYCRPSGFLLAAQCVMQSVLCTVHQLLSGSGKPKNWKCERCEKAYIGRAGLARHYRMKPGHGKMDIDNTGKLIHDLSKLFGTNTELACCEVSCESLL